jgi:hypothetical protein
MWEAFCQAYNHLKTPKSVNVIYAKANTTSPKVSAKKRNTRNVGPQKLVELTEIVEEKGGSSTTNADRDSFKERRPSYTLGKNEERPIVK